MIVDPKETFFLFRRASVKRSRSNLWKYRHSSLRCSRKSSIGTSRNLSHQHHSCEKVPRGALSRRFWSKKAHKNWLSVVILCFLAYKSSVQVQLCAMFPRPHALCAAKRVRIEGDDLACNTAFSREASGPSLASRLPQAVAPGRSVADDRAWI